MNLGSAQNLQPALGRIIHEEHGDAIVVLKISNTNVLGVAAQISEADGLFVHHAKKALRSASILDIWPAGFRNRSHIEAIPFADEGLLVGAKTVAKILRLFHSFV